ncbi:MAG: hypothetical protein AMXMBFR53_34150 [Gemmatimonadota bacterium]
MSVTRRLLGLGLLAAAWLPLHRLLVPATSGLAGAVTRDAADQAWLAGAWGTVLVAGGAAALAILWKRDPAPLLERAAAGLTRVPPGAFVAGCSLVALVLSAAASRVLFGGLPTSVDEMVQLLHARVLLDGRAALPLPGNPAAWMVQNSWLTPAGWASVYPPFHTMALAAGLAAGAAWVVGPLATAATAGLTCLALARLLPDRPALARSAALLVALSPFLTLLGGTYLSHTSAAALAALTLWSALVARDGRPGWSLLTGAAVGAFVCARPWTGMALSAALVGSAWLPVVRLRGLRWAGARGLGLVAGGVPFAALLLGWNRALFGDAFRLGYAAAFGPAHGLGFHPDPWGNAYGVREALAYTGADLMQLGAVLLESPLPAVGLVGLALLAVPAAWAGTLPLLAWALAGVAANAVYWHHGIHLGPRMLYESAPAWAALWALAAAALMGARTRLPPVAARGVTWLVALSLLGAAALAPRRAASYAGGAAAATRLQIPDSPAVVFAHGSWSSRVAARLAAAGMRRDSVETALRRNDLCAVDAYGRWRAAGGAGTPPPLDFAPRPGPAPELVVRELSPGNVIRARPGLDPTSECLREARSDRLGSVELEPLLWQAPPLEGAGVVLARDLGPADNAGLLERHPGARAYVLVADEKGGYARVLSYVEGMALLWGGAAGAGGGGGGGRPGATSGGG